MLAGNGWVRKRLMCSEGVRAVLSGEWRIGGAIWPPCVRSGRTGPVGAVGDRYAADHGKLGVETFTLVRATMNGTLRPICLDRIEDETRDNGGW